MSGVSAHEPVAKLMIIGLMATAGAFVSALVRAANCICPSAA